MCITACAVEPDVRYEEGGQGPDFRVYRAGRQILAVEVLSLFLRAGWASEAHRHGELSDRLNKTFRPQGYFLHVEVLQQQQGVNLRALLDEMIRRGASDLHITAGERPKFRIDGQITNASFDRELSPKETLAVAYSILTESQKKRFETEDELDFSFGIQNLSRFRGNVFKQRGCVSMVIRQIPFQIKTADQLGLPTTITKLAEKPRGLVLVTGPTGSGKSTTLAAMIDKINREERGHILTVEDPIEFVHKHQGCIVNQREVGADTKSFSAALKYALRQDPDVVLVGEMRDLETIGAALTIAETGHLAFATLHTNSCAETINRIIDVFPSNQ